MSEEEVVARLRAAGCVFAEEEARLLLGVATGDALEVLVGRRAAGEPLEHLLGWVELAGRRHHVTPGVFVPRRRSELLISLAVSLATGVEPVVVDLCCGSGALGASVAARLPEARVWASDVDPVAVACARRNLPADRVLLGDLLDPLPERLRGAVDVVVANAPYVPTGSLGAMPPEARDHEPRVALDGGEDGVDLHRRVAAAAPKWLAPGGHLVLETGRDQVPLTVEACRRAGLEARVETDDELDATAVVARPTRRLDRL